MLKVIAVLSMLFQTMVSIIGNERGEIVVEPIVPEVIAPKVDPVEPIVAPEKPVVVDPQLSKNDLLRELSKENGVNLFDVEGIKKFKEYQDSQKTETERLQTEIDTFKTKETDWLKEKNDFNSKLKASELGIPQDKLEDALKLAGGDPEKLADVIKKYPIFVSKEGIKIGVTIPDNNEDLTGMTEAEKYMAKNYPNNPYVKTKK